MVDRHAPLHAREIRGVQPIEDEGLSDRVVVHERRAGREHRLPHRLERRHRRVEDVLEVVVHRLLQHLERGARGCRRRDEAERADRFEPDARRLVAHHRREQAHRALDAIEPELEDAYRRGPGAELLGLQQARQERPVHAVVMLVHPERLEEVMLVLGVARIEPLHPALDRGQDLFRRPIAQSEPRLVARAILVGLQQVELLPDRGAVDHRGIEQGPALRGDAPHAAAGDVAAGIPQRVLHVPDERVEPVDDVERAVGPELHADRAEVRVRGLEQWLDLQADEARALFHRAVLLDALEADDVVVEEVALRGLGEVAAADELAAARRAHAGERPLAHRPLLARIVDVAGECGAPVVVAVRGVGHEVLAPAIDDVTPRVREGVRDEDVSFSVRGS